MENKTVTQQQNEELLKAILELPEAEQENVKAYMAGMQAARRILSLSDAEAVDIFADFEFTEDGHAAIVSEVADVERKTASLCALVAVQTAAAAAVSALADGKAEIRSFLI